MTNQDIGEEDTIQSFESLGFRKLQIFAQMFCENLLSLVWSRHVGGVLCSTSMVAGKGCKHLELTLAI